MKSKSSVPNMLSVVLASALLASCASYQSNTAPVVKSDIGNFYIYPDMQDNVVHVGEPIVFEFNPKDSNININAVQINTGEPEETVLSCGKNISCKGKNVRVSHKYQKAGSYNVAVQYQGNTVAARKIIILNQYLTDRELYHEAIKQVAVELQKGMEKVAEKSSPYKGEMPKFAFSSLRDANFDYGNMKDVEVIYGLMQYIVEIKDMKEHSTFDYAILERAPQALVRLAHESLYIPDTQDPEGNMIEKKQQEYGLRTRFINPKKPIEYAIELSGVNDTRSIVETNDIDNDNKESKLSRQSQQKGNADRSRRKEYVTQGSEGKHQKSLSNRPLMFALFDTADFLVVIGRIEDTPSANMVQRSKADYYDTTYNAKAIKRTATVKVNARILDKNGQIMWIKDISKQASDLVLPDQKYSPPIQTWEEVKSKSTAQKSFITPGVNIGSAMWNVVTQGGFNK